MKKTVFVVAALVSLSGACLAEGDKDLLTYQLSDDACAMIVSHQPDNDLNVTYQPGVDVHGKPVVEADLDSAVLPAPEEVSFDLTVDMAQYLGVTTAPKPEGQIGLGRITVKRSGEVLMDGNPLESRQQAALRALCAEEKAAKTGVKVPLDKPVKPLYNR